MMTVMMNASTNRCRMLAWMREPEWKWHIVHTDYMADTQPKALPSAPVLFKQIQLGVSPTSDLTNGPNDTERHTNGTN